MFNVAEEVFIKLKSKAEKMIEHLSVTSELQEMVGRDDKKAQAARLTFIRNYVGLDRHKFSKLLQVHYVTLKRWEAGGFRLPPKRMQSIIKILQSIGVQCSLEWFVNGNGGSPMWTQDKIIADELNYYVSHMPNRVGMILENDAMSPQYCKGDAVGGTKFVGNEIDKALGKFCIVELADGARMVCKLQPGSTAKHYILEFLHSEISPQRKVAINNVKLNFAAPIEVVWYRNS